MFCFFFSHLVEASTGGPGKQRVLQEVQSPTRHQDDAQHGAIILVRIAGDGGMGGWETQAEREAVKIIDRI